MDVRVCNPREKVDTISASAKRRGITPQLFAARGRTQERNVAACPTRPRFVWGALLMQQRCVKCVPNRGCHILATDSF